MVLLRSSFVLREESQKPFGKTRVWLTGAKNKHGGSRSCFGVCSKWKTAVNCQYNDDNSFLCISLPQSLCGYNFGLLNAWMLAWLMVVFTWQSYLVCGSHSLKLLNFIKHIDAFPFTVNSNIQSLAWALPKCFQDPTTQMISEQYPSNTDVVGGVSKAVR